jgi:hypothetical protein
MILTLSLRTEGAYERPLVPHVSEGMSVLARLEVDLGACDEDLVLLVVLLVWIAVAHLLTAEECFRFL